MKIVLGDEVKDTITGFQGIAIARYSYLQGCDRICIQPPVDKDKKLPETATFDEPQLKCINLQKIKRTASMTNPGGPNKYPDSRNY